MVAASADSAVLVAWMRHRILALSSPGPDIIGDGSERPPMAAVPVSGLQVT